jgi:hypothetical protein
MLGGALAPLTLITHGSIFGEHSIRIPRQSMLFISRMLVNGLIQRQNGKDSHPGFLSHADNREVLGKKTCGLPEEIREEE